MGRPTSCLPTAGRKRYALFHNVGRGNLKTSQKNPVSMVACTDGLRRRDYDNDGHTDVAVTVAGAVLNLPQ